MKISGVICLLLLPWILGAQEMKSIIFYFNDVRDLNTFEYLLQTTQATPSQFFVEQWEQAYLKDDFANSYFRLFEGAVAEILKSDKSIRPEFSSIAILAPVFLHAYADTKNKYSFSAESIAMAMLLADETKTLESFLKRSLRNMEESENTALLMTGALASICIQNDFFDSCREKIVESHKKEFLVIVQWFLSAGKNTVNQDLYYRKVLTLLNADFDILKHFDKSYHMSLMNALIANRMQGNSARKTIDDFRKDVEFGELFIDLSGYLKGYRAVIRHSDKTFSCVLLPSGDEESEFSLEVNPE